MKVIFQKTYVINTTKLRGSVRSEDRCAACIRMFSTNGFQPGGEHSQGGGENSN